MRYTEIGLWTAPDFRAFLTTRQTASKFCFRYFNLRPYAKAFAAADTSGRGTIDENQLKGALVALGMGEVSDAEVAAIIHAADAERSGGGGGLVGVKDFTDAAVALSERREKAVATQMAEGVDARSAGPMVERCKLTVSNSVLKHKSAYDSSA